MNALINITRHAKGLDENVKSRLHYFNLISILVRRELKVKYRGTFLGYAWSMLNPLLTMLIITIVFHHFNKGTPDYNLFVLSGILAWNLASQTITLGTQAIVNAQGLLKKVKLPIWIFPMVPLGASATNFALSLIPFTIFFIVSGRSISGSWYLFIPIFLIFTIFLCGISLCLSSLNVFFRDIGHTLEPVMSLFFYASPIVYDRTSGNLSEKTVFLLGLNPFTHFIEAMRASLYGGEISGQKFLLITGLACLSMFFGFVTYKLSKDKILYRI
ncbi:MAG: ABC transporter permease [Proteobacteria bacterium]|nr:MAG: ABC transporter permease [Pseudomonadota bacterium]